MLVLPSLQAFDIANGKIGAERTPQKTEVIYRVSGLDTAPPDWKISEVRLLASVDTAVRGNVTLRVAVGPRRCVTDQLVAKADVIRAVHERVQRCQIRRQNLPSSVEAQASAESITSSECMVTPPKPLMRLGKGHYRGQHGASRAQRRPVRCWLQQVR